MESGAEQITILTLFLQADPVVKGVMLILAVASVWSWAIAVDKWLAFGELEQNARKFEREFWSGRSLDDIEDRGDKPRDALSRVYAAASREWREARRTGTNGENAQMMLDRVGRLMQAQVAREHPGAWGHGQRARQAALPVHLARPQHILLAHDEVEHEHAHHHRVHQRNPHRELAAQRAEQPVAQPHGRAPTFAT